MTTRSNGAKLTEASAFAQIQGILEQAERELLAVEYDGLMRDVAMACDQRLRNINAPLQFEIVRRRPPGGA
jgi:hypothetical protein